MQGEEQAPTPNTLRIRFGKNIAKHVANPVVEQREKICSQYERGATHTSFDVLNTFGRHAYSRFFQGCVL